MIVLVPSSGRSLCELYLLAQLSPETSVSRVVF
nr:MAG TPA: hypothetical protein [Caudoviricetes sp.]